MGSHYIFLSTFACLNFSLKKGVFLVFFKDSLDKTNGARVNQKHTNKSIYMSFAFDKHAINLKQMQINKRKTTY